MHIEGYFNEHDEPCLSFDLGSGAIEVLIDTGFSGSLIIPQTVANDLALNFEGVEEFYTATGQMFLARVYHRD